MANFKSKLSLDVSEAIDGVAKVEKKITMFVDNVRTLRSLKATANVDVDVDDSEVAELKKDIAAVDGKNVDVNVNVKQPSGGLTAFTAGIGAAVGGAALTGVTALAEGLLEGAQAADAFGDTLSIAFTQQGIADVEGEIESVKQSTLSLAQELGLPIARVRELGQAVATIGGLSGEQAEGLTKLSVSIETFTDGTVKGEAIVKAFSRGIADPEGAAAIDALSKKYPQLSDTLRSTASASEKLAEANKILGPSFAAAVAGANDVGGVIQRVKNTVSEGFENVGTKIADAILPIITFILDTFTRLQPVLAPLIASIAEKFELVGKIIAPILAFIGGAIITNIVTTIQFAGAVLTTALGLFEKAFNAVALSIQPLIDAVKKLFGANGELGKGVDVLELFQHALSFVGEAFGAISDIVVELGGLLFDFVLTPFQAVIAIIAGVITKVQEWFGASKEANEEQKKGASILEILRTAFANIQGTIAGVTSAFRTIKEVIGEFFAALGSFDIQRALAAFTGFGDKVKESYDKGFDSVAKLKAEEEAATKARELAGKKQEDSDNSREAANARQLAISKKQTEESKKAKIVVPVVAAVKAIVKIEKTFDQEELERALEIADKAIADSIAIDIPIAYSFPDKNIIFKGLQEDILAVDFEDIFKPINDGAEESIASISEKFRAGAISYQSALKDIADSTKPAVDRLALIFDSLARNINASTEASVKTFAELSEKRKEILNDASLSDAEREKELQAQGATASDVANAQSTALQNVAASAGASFASLIANGESFGAALLKTAAQTAQSLLAIYAPQIIGAFTIAIPGPVGFIAGGVAVATLGALLAAASTGFKDGGPTGDNIGSNQVAGVVHGKEFVAPERMYAKHGDLLKHLYANRELSSFPEIQSLMKQNQIIPMRDIALNMGGGSQSITVNAMAADALKPLQDELQGVRRQLVAMEALHKSSSNITVTADEGYHARRARRSAIKGARN